MVAFLGDGYVARDRGLHNLIQSDHSCLIRTECFVLAFSLYFL